MLISVSIKNFKSIRDEVELSMVPHNYIKDKREHIIESSSNKSVQALPLAVLYGKNGSGKTKFVEALEFIKDKIIRGGGIKTTPIRLGDANQEKQTFRNYNSFQIQRCCVSLWLHHSKRNHSNRVAFSILYR